MIDRQYCIRVLRIGRFLRQNVVAAPLRKTRVRCRGTLVSTALAELYAPALSHFLFSSIENSQGGGCDRQEQRREDGRQGDFEIETDLTGIFTPLILGSVITILSFLNRQKPKTMRGQGHRSGNSRDSHHETASLVCEKFDKNKKHERARASFGESGANKRILQCTRIFGRGTGTKIYPMNASS